MTTNLPPSVRVRWCRLALLWLATAWSANPASSATAGARQFHVSAGEAPGTLEEFSRQSGEQIVYFVEKVRGERTHAAEGELSPQAALEIMLEGTTLAMHRDPASGAMIVARRAVPSERSAVRVARRKPAAPAGAGGTSNEVVVLSAFTVSMNANDRYRATEAISAVRVRAALADTPASISVVTREMMDDLAPTRIFDVTRYMAGIQDGRGLQFQDRMIIRGFESNGQRSVDNFIQSEDADNINEAIIDRIEITKGPNAILSPAGAPGGSINVVTKAPLFHTQRSFTTTLGLYDAQKMAVDLAGPAFEGGRFAYRLVGSWQDSRRYWASDARLRGRLAAPMFSWRVSEKTMLTFKLVAAEQWIFREPLAILDPAVTAATDRPVTGPGITARSRNGIQPWSHVGTQSADVFAMLTTSLGENVELRVAANGRYYYEDSEQNFLSTPSFSNRYNPMTGELTQDHTWSLNPVSGKYEPAFSTFYDPARIPNRADKQATHRETGHIQADIVARHTFGDIRSETVGGLAVSRRIGRGRGLNGLMPGIDLGEPDRRVDPVYDENVVSFDNRNSFTNGQAYVNQRVSFRDDAVHVTAGALRYETETYFRNLLTGEAPAVLHDGRTMWMGSVLWKVHDNVSLYCSHSTNSSPIIANNEALWRDGVQAEIGFKSELLGRRLSFNGAWFEIAQTNVTIPNPARQTDAGAPETLVSDFGNTGFEFELTGNLTPDLSAIATYSHLKMRDSLGRHVRGVADDHAALLLNYRITQGALSGLSLTFGVNYSGRRAGDVPVNFTPLGVVGKTSFFLEPYFATTFGMSCRLGEKYLVRLNVDNVFDEKDFIVVAGGRVSGTGITTQPGLNVKFSTTVQF